MQKKATLEQQLKKTWSEYRHLRRKVQRHPHRKWVHNLRVLTQELEAQVYLAELCCPQVRVKALKKNLRKTRSQLGELRDAQVREEILQAKEDSHLKSLQRSFVKRRKKCEESLQKFLKRTSLHKAQAQIQRLADKARLPEILSLESELTKRWQSLAKLPRKKLSPQKSHQRRKLAKKIYYECEVLQLIKPSFKFPEEKLQQIRQLGGEIQDRRVLLESLKHWQPKQQLQQRAARKLRLELRQSQLQLLKKLTGRSR